MTLVEMINQTGQVPNKMTLADGSQFELFQHRNLNPQMMKTEKDLEKVLMGEWIFYQACAIYTIVSLIQKCHYNMSVNHNKNITAMNQKERRAKALEKARLRGQLAVEWLKNNTLTQGTLPEFQKLMKTVK